MELPSEVHALKGLDAAEQGSAESLILNPLRKSANRSIYGDPISLIRSQWHSWVPGYAGQVRGRAIGAAEKG